MKLYTKTEIFQKISDFFATHPQGVLEILGPTASGKTSFSIIVAKKFNPAEIISVDSRQIFRELNISAAKISSEEMDGIPHYGLDLRKPDEPFSVYEFQQYTFKIITEILKRKSRPILCGGTMLWLDAVSENYAFTEDGTKTTKKKSPQWTFLKIGIHWPREVLYDRINQRAQEQFENGLIEETQYILNKYQLTHSAFTSFGYEEIKDYLDGKISYTEALYINQKRNRNYAKRQLTWWRGREEVFWLDGATI